MDFSWLLSPFNHKAFADHYWAKKTLRISRSDALYYSQLLPEKEMEFALYTASKTRGAVELLSEEDKPQMCRSHEQALEGFRQGKSLRIDGIQRFSYPITILSRNLEQAISCPVNVNMYLSPGSGKKALQRHYDTHDVFVLQVHGNKTWRLYGPPFPSPIEFFPLQRHESLKEMTKFRLSHDMSGKDSCSLTDEFILEAGDFLYLPRGFWHEAESAPGDVSCHLTVGIQPSTYLDVLTVALSKSALSDVRLREPLPFGFASSPTASSVVTARVAEILTEIPQRLNTDTDTESALEEVKAHFHRLHRKDFENNLLRPIGNSSVKNLNGESQIHVNENMVCRVTADMSPAQMVFGSQAFEITSAYEEACRFISKSSNFRVSELPGEISLGEKLALVYQLISEGLLTSLNSNNFSVESRNHPPKWLPIQLNFRSNRIEWLDFGTRSLMEPFFQQTISKLKKENPNVRVRSTPIRALETVEEDILPSGFIFHISRCGSTLLSNGLKALPGTIVISEPQPINEALALMSNVDMSDNRSSQQLETCHEILRNLVRAYGQHRTATEKSLVIKFSSWNILQIARIRDLWPQVPCVVVVRDPIEVAVSCLEQFPGWMRWKEEPHTIKSIFGWDRDTLSKMSDSTFCARVIGEFLKCASSAVNAGCQIIDYKDLTKSSIGDIAQLFAIDVKPEDVERIGASLSVYSKDPHSKRLFLQDQEFKQAKATNLLRSEIRAWALTTFEKIRCADIERA